MILLLQHFTVLTANYYKASGALGLKTVRFRTVTSQPLV